VKLAHSKRLISPALAAPQSRFYPLL